MVNRLRHRPVYCLLLLMLLLPSPLLAETTAITLYDAEIGVMQDGLVLVKETISLEVADASPTEMPRSFALAGEADTPPQVEVRTVQLDGLDASHTLAVDGSVLTLVVPINDRLIAGTHTLYLEYSVSNLLEYGQEADSLTWNVTGDDWFIPIVKARAVIYLPGAADILTQEAATGTAGAPSQRYFLGSNGEGRPVFETSSPLLPGERLVISLSWPKGVIQPSTGPGLISGSLMALAAAVLSALLIIIARRRSRKVDQS